MGREAGETGRRAEEGARGGERGRGTGVMAMGVPDGGQGAAAPQAFGQKDFLGNGGLIFEQRCH